MVIVSGLCTTRPAAEAVKGLGREIEWRGYFVLFDFTLSIVVGIQEGFGRGSGGGG